jgi:uncharacterized membrane protein
MMRSIKRLSMLCCILAAVMGFMIFVPVITIQANAPSVGMGSITFCYLGQGALLVHGEYYPLTNSTTQTRGGVVPESTTSCPILRLRQSG